MLFDLPLEQLITYRPPRIEPEDFDLFWSQTLADARRYPLDARFPCARKLLIVPGEYPAR